MVTLPDAAIQASYVEQGGCAYWMEKAGSTSHLVIAALDGAVPEGFTGHRDGDRVRAPLTPANALALRGALPNLSPGPVGPSTSVGFGDRLGLCTPGHVAALRAVDAQITPVFAQQSIREMGRTHRTPREVLDDATWGAFQAGWRGPVGADADHLHTTDDIDACVEAGFCFFTLDPNDHVNPEAENATPGRCRQIAESLDWSALDSSMDDYLARHAGRRIDLDTESITLDPESVIRALAKYGDALVQTMRLHRHLASSGVTFEVELAVDETEYPTRPVEHVVLMSELARLGVRPVSFAPRFQGGFEKGVEHIGDLETLARDFEVHAQIARAIGPYKLSLHSGSDKYSTYPLIAEATRGLVHLKTAGTSWVEALRVIARHDPDLFREILDLSIREFDQNTRSYHLSCDPARIPLDVPDAGLDDLITWADSRQVLHVGYGAALDAYRSRMYACWQAHDAELTGVIADHFVRHLAPFQPWAASKGRLDPTPVRDTPEV
ncbi:MAG: tagaturonate epimerase family protein [Propionibacteriaceae bacterium]|nr:tagaturonate epimerase family protein [Propionibacteriaceae bacterium]